MERVPLLYKGLVAVLHDIGAALGGDADMRSVKFLEATLYPSGTDKTCAVNEVRKSYEKR